MKTEGKSPVVILQELIAMITTRKEACQRISDKSDNRAIQEELKTYSEQSDRITAELMDELSQYGDAVTGDPERENLYQNAWKETLPMLDIAKSGVLRQRFFEMETMLSNTYHSLLSDEVDMPETLRQKLETQSVEVDTGATNK